jgi:2'-hydroxyisoflavone reductase
VPAPPRKIAQFVDARDLGEWLVESAERGTTGLFIAVAPPVPFEELLESCAAAAGRRRRRSYVWADDAFLIGHGLHPYTDLPLWVPGDARPFDGSKAAAAGLRSRPAADTARDVLAWHEERGAPSLQAGLRPELEDRLIHELQHKK